MKSETKKDIILMIYQFIGATIIFFWGISEYYVTGFAIAIDPYISRIWNFPNLGFFVIGSLIFQRWIWGLDI